MTDIRAELNSKWNDAALTSRAAHEWRGVALSIAAPVRLLAAVREPDDRIALLIEGPVTAAPSSLLRFQAEGLSLADQRRSDENLFRLAIVLERDELRDVFEVLSADLVSIASNTTTPVSAVAAVANRLEAWQACLRSRRTGLSREEQLGLLGELMVLRLLAAEVDYPCAVEAWKGPLDGLHDFSESGVAIEVKSVLGPGTHLQISRFDQLETDGLSCLIVARPRFREGTDGKSLSQHVLEVRNEIRKSSPGIVSEFDERLLRAGYLDADAPKYSALIAQDSFSAYEVRDGFPRLLRSSIPSGVVDGTYIVDERAMIGFKQDKAQLRRLLKSATGRQS
jgi:hypothetical protein